jgi:hypothetical protein
MVGNYPTNREEDKKQQEHTLLYITFHLVLAELNPHNHSL